MNDDHGGHDEVAAENTGPGPRKRPGYRRLPPGQRREEIIAAAIATFSADHDASLGDVAATAGLSRTSLYRFFETRQELVTAAFQSAGDGLLEHVRDAPFDPPSLALVTRLHRFFDYVEEHESAFVGIVTWNSPMASEEVRAVAQKVRDELCAMTYRVIEVTEATPLLETVVRTWIAAVEDAALQWLATRRPSRDEVEIVLAANLGTALLNAAPYDPVVAERVRWWFRAEPSNGPLSVHLRCLAGVFNTGLFSSIARLLIEDRS